MFQLTLWRDDAPSSKKEITPNTAHAVKEITTLVGMLVDYYHKDRETPLFVEEDEGL